ncbi:MAG: anti-sigma factor [Thermoleophilia bacterium]|nr:anti-sigma factor [Thermoleophilia bacterium]
MNDENDSSQFEIDRATLAFLEESLPRVLPPADMFDRILAEIRPEATVVPLRPRAHRRVIVPVAGALAAVAAVVLIAVVALGVDDLGSPDARAAISGKSDPAVTGEAKLFGANADGGTVRVSLRDVPPAPSGHHYEVWVLRRDAGGEMEAVGSFTPTSSNVTLDLTLPGPGDYAAVDVSIEENGGPPIHSDTSLAGGTFS